ncbi:MAG: luciferase oxidoreductase, group 1 family protein [Betaproteobacteria bacterium]|nr:luciferase oxidoreductase, group 1 family protein [Betaproteobacteria bacterium]
MTKLSILDQSPIISGHNPVEAIAATVELAQLADQLGYERYWLAEHHGLNALADPCPEILLARLGSVTKHIRIGTGGILLPYYSPFKVAEQFRMLEALFPGRLDLGIGRAPGGDMRTAQAVMGSTTGGSYNAAEFFPQQVMELIAHLDGVIPPDHPHAGVVLQPQCSADDKGGAPQIWVLGSSDYGGAMAAHLGLRFAFAHFINAYGGAPVAQAYRDEFKPTPHADQTRGAVTPVPYSAVAVFAIAAETQAQADELATSVDVRRVQMAYGINAPIATVEEAKTRAAHFNERDRAIIERERPRAVVGTPDKVAARIREVQAEFAADEVVVLGVAASYKARLKSYELLAREFELKSR